MTDSVTHLLWGYSISKNISENKGYIIFGIIASIFLDIDYLLSNLKHHGFVHTPLFVIIVCVLVYLLSKSRIIFGITLGNLLFHLVLDTIGTAAPVMWLYPINESAFALGSEISLTALIIIKLTLFIIPLVYILYRYYKTGDNPFELIAYMKNKLGTKVTYILLIIFAVLIVYIGITEYLMKLI